MTVPFSAYETVIGFECHIQLKTRSKLFSSGPVTYGEHPNSAIDIIDIGLPGVLPSCNKEAVSFAIKLGLALSCDIKNTSIFARKHYFYPDLPKGYQISQYDKPICENGHLDIEVDGKQKRIGITRIHIEEDAGKNIHAEDSNVSYVDFNRAGTALLEVVTEPDMRTPEEAAIFFKKLRQIAMYLNICDGNMAEGSMRADANVSVRKIGSNTLGTRTETKNLNSFKFLAQAISFESKRQIIELEQGNKISQETRLWDPNLKESRPLRSKEEAKDYRYFPDPDLPPLFVSNDILTSIKNTLPELPQDKSARFQADFGLSKDDAELLCSDKNLAKYFENTVSYFPKGQKVANWIINELLRKDHSEDSESIKICEEKLAQVLQLIEEQKISNTIAKKIVKSLLDGDISSPLEIATKNNWLLLNDDNEMNKIIDQLIEEQTEEVQKYLSGKEKVFGFLMGQVMRKTKNRIDPESASKLLLDKLTKLKDVA